MTADAAPAPQTFTFPFRRDSPIQPPPDYPSLRAARVTRITMPTGDPAYLLGRYEDARRLLADPRLSSDLSRPGTPQLTSFPPDDSMHHSDPPRHTRLRTLVSKAFTPRRVAAMRPRVQELATQLVDAMVEQGPPADLNAAFAHPLPITVICELLGVPAADQGEFRGWADRLVALADVPAPLIAQAYMAMRDYLARLVADKRAHPADDMLSALVQARDGSDRLSESELLSMATLLLIAGYETSIHQIGSAVVMLLLHPEQLAALRAQPSAIDGAVDELMRFQGPGDGALYRIALADIEVGETVIPAGSGVLLAIGAANRDEERFAQPERLDIARQDNAHLTFGHGIHYCVGAALGRLELAVALETLTRRLPRMRLAVQPEELRWLPGRLLSGYAEIPLAW